MATNYMDFCPLWEILQHAKMPNVGKPVPLILSMVSEQQNSTNSTTITLPLLRSGFMTEEGMDELFGPELVMDCCLAAQVVHTLLDGHSTVNVCIGAPVEAMYQIYPKIVYFGPVDAQIHRVVMKDCTFMQRGQYAVEIPDPIPAKKKYPAPEKKTLYLGLTTTGWICQTEEQWIRHVQANYQEWLRVSNRPSTLNDNLSSLRTLAQAGMVRCILGLNKLEVVCIEKYVVDEELKVCNMRTTDTTDTTDTPDTTDTMGMADV